MMRSDKIVSELFIKPEMFVDLQVDTLNLTRLCLDTRKPDHKAHLGVICGRFPNLKILVIAGARDDPGVTSMFYLCPNLTELELCAITITQIQSEHFRHLTQLKKLSLLLSNRHRIVKPIGNALGRSLKLTQIECLEFSFYGAQLTFDLIQNILDHVDLPCLKALSLTHHQFDKFSERLRNSSNPKSFLLAGPLTVNVNGRFYELSADCCDHFFQWDDLNYFYQ